mgnify:CR=1 FL=1
MFSDVFIRRPILATVCSLVIILAGAMCIPLLPIARYPALAARVGVVFPTGLDSRDRVLEHHRITRPGAELTLDLAKSTFSIPIVGGTGSPLVPLAIL